VNSLERSLIAKTGYDHGWEVIVDETSVGLVLGSANHAARASIVAAGNGGWSVTLPASAITVEMTRIPQLRQAPGGAFLAQDDRELSAVLSHASRLARTLPDLPRQQYARKVAEELGAVHEGPSATEVERLVRQRVGQDIYRQSQLDYWGGACAVTGIALPELLRASHAKPWAECDSDDERLDVFNGFLLAAHLDALFDRHLMTFDPTGRALFSPRLDPQTRTLLGIDGDLRLRWISPEHYLYLSLHRKLFASQTNS
jgi:putative restriction endonuclease